MSYSYRDIVLIEWVSPDRQSNKARTALVISSDDYNKSDLDRILIPISSNISRSCQYDVAVMQDEKCYGATGLRSSSVIRVGKIITLHTNLIKRRLGYLTSDKMVEVNSKIREVINL